MSARAAAVLLFVAVSLPRIASATPTSDDEEEEPPPSLHEHGGVAAAVGRTTRVLPNGIRYAEGWAGSDAVLHAAYFDVAGGPGFAYHALAPTRGNSGVLSWGAGAHVDLLFELAHDHRCPVLLHLDGAMFSHHGLTDRVLRGTIALTIRFR